MTAPCQNSPSTTPVTSINTISNNFPKPTGNLQKDIITFQKLQDMIVDLFQTQNIVYTINSYIHYLSSNYTMPVLIYVRYFLFALCKLKKLFVRSGRHGKQIIWNRLGFGERLPSCRVHSYYVRSTNSICINRRATLSSVCIHIMHNQIIRLWDE